MRALRLFALPALMLASACPPEVEAPPPAPPLVDLVDPVIGTGGFGFRYGGSFLGAAAPHGLVKVGPDTTGDWGEIRFVHTSGSWVEDPTILAFSHVHLQGTGLPEGGVVAVMPTTTFDPAKRSVVAYQATRVDEVAKAGLYEVTLLEPDVRVSLTATTHGAHHRYTFPADTANAAVVLDLDRTLTEGTVYDATIDSVSRTRIRGRLHTEGSLSPPGGYEVFFVLEANAPFVPLAWADGSTTPSELPLAASISGTGMGVALGFGAVETVELRVALSLVDGAGAEANLDAELPAFDHEGTIAGTRAAWDALLSRVSVKGGSADHRKMLASALYRSFLMPTVISDVDGRWRNPAGDVVAAEGFRMMSDMSLWDTYRTLHPMYALLAPESARDAALSLIAFGEEAGFHPLWPMATGDAAVMIGNPAEIVLADALLRGVITNDDVARAWPVMRAAALDETEPPAGRSGRGNVLAYDGEGGYIPAPLRGPVSGTLELNHADLSLARIAFALGEDADGELLFTRSFGWRQLYDVNSRFLRGRDAGGAFYIPDDEFEPEAFTEDYVEADAWQSNFPYDDIPGIVAVFGTSEDALARLRELLDNTIAHWEATDREAETFGIQPPPYHWQGNEVDLHVPFLAYDLGDKALGAEFVAWVMDNEYGPGADGIPGNDDGGALSSWWALAAMGLHPVPGGEEWVLGAPLFEEIKIARDGLSLTIARDGTGREPEVFTLGAVRTAGPRVTHGALVAADTLTVSVR